MRIAPLAGLRSWSISCSRLVPRGRQFIQDRLSRLRSGPPTRFQMAEIDPSLSLLPSPLGISIVP